MKYSFKLVRSDRRSISVCVSPNNEITVRCPRRMPESKIKEFVESKEDWLDKIVANNNTQIFKNNAILNYKEIYVGGVKVPLIFSDKNEITQSAVYVKKLSDVKKLFISVFADKFIQKALSISEKCNLPANGFFIKSYKSRWGCCNSDAKITFNYLLFMLPAELQNYIIIHELCHTVYFNHSAQFWRLVGKYSPHYKSLRNELKSFNFITKLY